MCDRIAQEDICRGHAHIDAIEQHRQVCRFRIAATTIEAISHCTQTDIVTATAFLDAALHLGVASFGHGDTCRSSALLVTRELTRLVKYRPRSLITAVIARAIAQITGMNIAPMKILAARGRCMKSLMLIVLTSPIAARPRGWRGGADHHHASQCDQHGHEVSVHRLHGKGPFPATRVPPTPS